MVPVSTTTPFVVVTPTFASLLLLSAAISDFTAVVIRMSEVAVSVLKAAGAELEAPGSVLMATSGALAAIPLGADGVVGASTLDPPPVLPATAATAGFSFDITAESVRATLWLEVPTLGSALATGRPAADLGSPEEEPGRRICRERRGRGWVVGAQRERNGADGDYDDHGYGNNDLARRR